MPKPLQQKQEEAFARQQAYNKRTLSEKLWACNNRRGCSRREVVRLTKGQMAYS